MKRNIDIKCFKLKLKKEFNKDEKLNINYVEEEFIESYLDSIKLLVQYFSSTSELVGVDRIYRQGVLVRPQFSGRRKSYEKPAIGLTLSIVFYDKTYNKLKCKPLNVNELKCHYRYDDVDFSVSMQELLNNISWFIELSQVYPFAIVRIFKILYNPGESNFRLFLKKIYEKYDEALNETLKHLKLPSTPSVTINTLDEKLFIVIYRCQRSFVSSVLTPEIFNAMYNSGINRLILSNTIAYFTTQYEDIAYYYSLVLNYLVYKVKTLGGAFILNQYGRPIEAIRNAGLEWNGEDWQVEVAKLSKLLHKKARGLVLRYLNLSEKLSLLELVDKHEDIIIKEKLGKRVIDILKYILKDIPEANQAFKIIDKNIEENKLIEAVRVVASFGGNGNKNKRCRIKKTKGKKSDLTKIFIIDKFFENNP